MMKSLDLKSVSSNSFTGLLAARKGLNLEIEHSIHGDTYSSV